MELKKRNVVAAVTSAKLTVALNALTAQDAIAAMVVALRAKHVVLKNRITVVGKQNHKKIVSRSGSSLQMNY